MQAGPSDVAWKFSFIFADEFQVVAASGKEPIDLFGVLLL